MTKPREPGTYCALLRELMDPRSPYNRRGGGAIRLLCDAVGKPKDVLHRWSDPNDSHRPNLDQLMALEAALYAAGLPSLMGALALEARLSVAQPVLGSCFDAANSELLRDLARQLGQSAEAMDVAAHQPAPQKLAAQVDVMRRVLTLCQQGEGRAVTILAAVQVAQAARETPRPPARRVGSRGRVETHLRPQQEAQARA